LLLISAPTPHGPSPAATIDLTADIDHTGRLGFVFGNAVEDLFAQHNPTHIALARQQGDKAAARTLDCLAFVVHTVAYARSRESVELTADNVRARVLGNGRASSEMTLKYARKASWAHEAEAVLMVDFTAGKKAPRTVLASAIGYVGGPIGTARPTVTAET
jgi:hypothetical protein